MFVCRTGCVLPKGRVSMKEITAQLTVVRELDQTARGQPEDPIPVYRLTKNNIIVPKFFAMEYLGRDEAKEVRVKYGRVVESSGLAFKGSLRDYQQEMMDEVLPVVQERGGGLITMPCGAGKTTIALYIASQLRLKTLIVVHKSFLMNQWVERIRQFLPNAAIGTIQAQTIDVENKDIVIGMLQSLSMKDYDPRVFDHGLTIIDECHHISSRVFSQALFKINSPHMIGLSATPYRKDKLDRIFHWFVGPQIYNLDKKKVDFAQVHQYFFTTKNSLFRSVFCRGSKNFNTALMITNLTQIEERNEMIVEAIAGLERGRRVLLLSDRIEHLKKLEQLLLVAIPSLSDDIGYYIGGMKEEKLKISEGKSVILATYAYACEGLDIKGLDTVLLTTPRSTIEQSIGRILRNERLSDYRYRPLIIDFIDNISPFNGYFFVRNRLYLEKRFDIKKIDINRSNKSQ